MIRCSEIKRHIEFLSYLNMPSFWYSDTIPGERYSLHRFSIDIQCQQYCSTTIDQVTSKGLIRTSRQSYNSFVTILARFVGYQFEVQGDIFKVVNS